MGMAPAIALSLFLVLYNALTNLLLPLEMRQRLYVPLNLAAGAVLVAVGRWGLGLSWSALGWSSRGLAPALGWGVGVGLALAAPLFAALPIPTLRRLLADPRLEGVGPGGLAYLTLYRILLGTALFEEVAFRGVLYGVWGERLGVAGAFLGSSVAFGLWHIVPAWELLGQRPLFRHPALGSAGVTGAVAATTLGGLFFAWLRERSGIVYGPVLAHWLINALAAVAAFLAHRL